LSKRLIAMLAGVMAIAIVAAGCGSSDDSSTDTVVVLTKAEFIKQGDTICKQGNTEIEEGFERFAEENDIPKNQEPSKAQGVELVETVIVPSLKTQAESIRGLGTPEGDEGQAGTLLDSLDEAVETAEEEPEALFDEKSDPFADVNEQAQDYGFKECGEE
jgi:hypothetical protein